MASAATIPGERIPERTDPPKLVRLWSDKTRVEQLARLRGLPQLQNDQKHGQQAWEMAHEIVRNLPEWARVDLPSAHALAAILGVLRTGACLKTGKLLRLELSAQDIAELIGYSKSTVEAGLRILGSGPIMHHGQKIGSGAQLIHRARRTALGYLHGQLRRVYRTSTIVLTFLGRALLKLPSAEETRRKKQRQEYARRKEETEKAKVEGELERRRQELEHRELRFIEGKGHDGGGEPDESMTQEYGLEMLRKIREGL